MTLPNLFCIVSALAMAACNIGTHSADQPGLSLDQAASTPEVFAPGLISTSLVERDLAISPDGTQILWSVATPDQSVRAIAQITLHNGAWSAPAVVPFSGVHDDLEPAFAPDGQSLFFVSNRPLDADDASSDHNIWRVARTDGRWSAPTALDTVINTDGNEYYPSVAANGNLYFTASRNDTRGLEDIYVSRWADGRYGTPVSLDSAVNSALYEYNAFIAPDESYLIFGSYGRPEGLGGGDLFVSHRGPNGRWQPAVHLGSEINSPKLDYCPFVDVRHNIFYFTSARGAAEASGSAFTYDDIVRISASEVNGLSNIYRVRTEGVLHSD